MGTQQEQGRERGDVVSGLDKRIEVLRGGIPIGQAAISFADPNTSLAEAVYLKLQPGSGQLFPGLERGADRCPQTSSASEVLGEIHVPPPLGTELNKLLVPGTLLITTPGSLKPDNRSATTFVGVQASNGSSPSP